jgi:hypothetical protein
MFERSKTIRVADHKAAVTGSIVTVIVVGIISSSSPPHHTITTNNTATGQQLTRCAIRTSENYVRKNIKGRLNSRDAC